MYIPDIVPTISHENELISSLIKLLIIGFSPSLSISIAKLKSHVAIRNIFLLNIPYKRTS